MEYTELKSQISQKVKEYEAEMIESLQNLVRIPSVLGEAKDGKPFGEEVDRAYRYMLAKAEKDGFRTLDVDGYGGHIQFDKSDIDIVENENTIEVEDKLKNMNFSKTMGILVHLDVVPAGKDWNYDAFEGSIVESKLYGRGTIDDKGPAISAYYAMKIIKDMKLQIRNNIRLILGLDEETSWLGMEKYIEKAGVVDFGFTPDGGFPVIYGEKGILNFTIAKKFSKNKKNGLKIKKIEGGNAHNMVPDWINISLFSKDRELYDGVRRNVEKLSSEGYDIICRNKGQSLEVSANGVSAHGSTPEKGINAISIGIKSLQGIELNDEKTMEFIEFYNENIGFETDGKGLDINFKDKESGDTKVNIGVIELDEYSLKLKCNVRYPVTKSEDEIYRALSDKLTKYDMGIIKEAHKKPIYLDKNSWLVSNLVDIYRDVTGDIKTEPMVIGGGTYARAMENCVAYGAVFPYEEEIAHQKDEFISLDSLRKMTEIYALAICRLCI